MRFRESASRRARGARFLPVPGGLLGIPLGLIVLVSVCRAASAGDDLGAPPVAAPPVAGVIAAEGPQTAPSTAGTAAAPSGATAAPAVAVEPAPAAAAPPPPPPPAEETALPDALRLPDATPPADDVPAVIHLLPTPEETAATAATAVTPEGWVVSPTAQRFRGSLISGSLQARYRYRHADGATDQDIYAYLRLQYRDDWSPGISATFTGRLSQDIDSFRDHNGFYVFDGITDTYRSSLNGKVYSAYLTWRPTCSSGLEMVRLGRQEIDAGDYFLVDGAKVRTRPMGAAGLQLTGFAGVPSHLYEGSIDGDYIVGASAEARPWRGGDVRFDYVHVEDRNRYYGAEHNNLYMISGHHVFSPDASVRASYQHINSDPGWLDVTGSIYNPRVDVFVRGSFRSLLHRLTSLAYDVDPYFVIAQDFQPYWEGLLAVTKPLGCHLDVEGGVAARELYKDSSESRYNHEWQRYYLTLTTNDWPLRHVSVSATGELWQGRQDVSSFGFEIEHKPSRCWRLRVGSDFALYRTDFYADDERVNSQNYYVQARYAPNETWQFDLRLAVEHDDFDTYTTVRAGLEYRF